MSQNGWNILYPRLVGIGASSLELSAIQAAYFGMLVNEQYALDTLVATLSSSALLIMLNTWRTSGAPFQAGFPGGGLPFGTGVAVLTDNTGDDTFAISAGTGRKIPSAIALQQFNVMNPAFGATGNGSTDDGPATNLAIIAASALAASTNQIVDVLMPPGFQFLIGTKINALNGVRLVASGAQILPNWASIGNKPLINVATAVVLSGFGIVGGSWAGTGAESGNQMLFASGTYGSGLGIQRARFTDMEVTNWSNGVLYLQDPYKVKVDSCRMDTVTVSGGANAINFVEADDAANVGLVLAEGNIVTNCGAGSIAYVKSGGTTTRDIRGLFRGNIVSGSSATGNSLCGGLDVEVANASATLLGLTMEGNHVNCPSTTGVWCINIGNASQGTITGIRVGASNRLEGGAGAVGVHIGLAASSAIVEHNTILTANKFGGAGTALHRENVYVEGAASNGRAVLSGSGTVTVSTAEVVAADNIILSRVVTGGTVGELTVGTIVGGTSFVINSSSSTDTSTVYWEIRH